MHVRRVATVLPLSLMLALGCAGTAFAAAPVAAASSAAVAATVTLPPNSVDPGVTGPYATTTGEYQLSDVTLPGFAQPVEMKAIVVAPQGLATSRPLVLFLHGRYEPCYNSSGISWTWPCPAGYSQMPSYQGFQQSQQLLASQGFVTVSISADGINAQDGQGLPPSDGGAQARSSLIRLHLAHWADWAGAGRSGAPAIVASAPVADMSKVLLVGHSRGGDGVGRAAMDSLTPPPAAQDGYHGTVSWQIKGLALIGTTSFGENPAPDVPSLSILPACDGDQTDLPGIQFLDATRGVSRGYALHSAVWVAGANHDYFNTQWTPGQSVSPVASDDYIGHDPYCSAGSATRLTYQQQQTAGATYVAAAARLFVNGEDAVRPLIDGSGYRAPSADPAQVLSQAVGGNRTGFVVPSSTLTVTGTGARLCDQVPTNPATACLTGWNFDSPHLYQLGFIRPEAGRYAVDMSWTTAGTRVTMRPAANVSLSGQTSVALRVIVPANSVGTQLQVAISDRNGRRATLGTVTLDGLPAPTFTASNLAQEVRMPLAPATSAGLSMTQIATLELTPLTANGKAAVVDAWGWRAGTPAPQPVALPRIDLGELTVAEGNSGTVTYQVPAIVTGSGTGQVRVFVVNPATNLATSTVVNVSPGQTTISIPIAVTGNTVDEPDRTYLVGAKAIKGVFVGDVFGALTVHDDD